MRALVIAMFALAATPAVSQDEINLDELSDSFLLSDDGESEDGSHLENMTQIFAHRLDLNKMDAEQLRSLNALTQSQIDALLTHREKHGRLYSIYELQSIDGAVSRRQEHLLHCSGRGQGARLPPVYPSARPV